MFFLLPLLFVSILCLLRLGPREGFCNGNIRETVFLLTWSNGKCSQALFLGRSLLGTCLVLPNTVYWKMLRNNSANSKIAKQTKPIETKVREQFLQILELISRKSSLGNWTSSFSSWLGDLGTGNTSTKPRDDLLFGLVGSNGTGPWAFWSIMSGDLSGAKFVVFWFLWFLLSSKKGLVAT